jgi:hypothetical protein
MAKAEDSITHESQAATGKLKGKSKKPAFLPSPE